MTLTSDSHPIDIPARYLRMQLEAVPATPAGGWETGATEHARNLAVSLCDVLNGATWQAITRYR
ncbi:hypothetical protein JNW91_00585 [Micromonospora sp. STR1_7]|uniref:Uncharacterized protein n=1 Tax=Micromonospora parastrephiae TaxID=2806101 RepID=A0ABS1XMM3_9ACTN|nr:hypothetical protein [Micromonospora parastrephiae]MBM0230498.1 hypothetical protein [Micromonospora parastrephiae]